MTTTTTSGSEPSARAFELDNRRLGDFELADICREVADATDRGDVLAWRMGLRRIVDTITRRDLDRQTAMLEANIVIR